ncbi:hypothetical protein ACWEQN_39470 [Streptomyces sp. NPDC004129]
MRVSRLVAALGVAAAALLGGATGAGAATHAPSVVSHATYVRGHDDDGDDYGRGDRDGRRGEGRWGDHRWGDHRRGEGRWGHHRWGDHRRGEGRWGHHRWGDHRWDNRHRRYHWGYDRDDHR